MSNLTGRLPQQYWSVLVGDQVLDGTLQNPNACHTCRSMERYVIHNLGNQVQVWKRILDKMGVAIVPNIKHPHYSELAEVFGWTTTENNAAMMIPATQCAVMIGLPLFMPRLILEQILHVFWYDFGIPHVGFYVSAAAAAEPTRLVVEPPTATSPGHDDKEEEDYEEKGNSKGETAEEKPAEELATKETTNQTNSNRTTEQPDDDVDGLVPIACVVDLGWSGTTIVPVYRDRVILTTTATTKNNNNNNINNNNDDDDDEPSSQHRGGPIVRRMHLGGRQMIQMLKYYLTYRQYNLMEQEFVLRHVLESTFYVSLQYEQDMRFAAAADNNGHNKRPLYDLDYILPDYETTKVGVVQVPVSVQRQLDRIKAATMNSGEKALVDEDEEDEDEEEDEDFRVDENQMQEDNDDDDVALVPGTVIEADDEEDEDDVEDDDEDEEDETTMRERVLAQRRAEEERRRADEAERQVLRLSLERFAIPELLFAPQDGNLPAEWANLPTAICQCIESCPPPYRAGLYRSIQLTGGLSMLPGLRSRLLREIRRLVHPDYNNVDYNEVDDAEENNDQPTATGAPPPLLHIRTLPDPLEASWRGGCRLVNNNNDNHHHHATTTDPAAATTTGPLRWCVSSSSSSSSGTPSTSSTAAAAVTASASWRKLLIPEGGYYF